MVAAALLFSTGGAAIKLTSLTSWQVASLRSGVALIALLVLLPEARRGWSWKSAGVGVAYAGALITYVLANKLTTAANTIFLQSTAPLYIAVLAPWLLHEKTRRRDLGFAATLFVGLGLLLTGGRAASTTAPDPALGNLLAIAAGICWALAVIGLRWMSRSVSAGGGTAGPAVALGNLVACLLCLPYALPIQAVSSSDLLIVLFLGVIQIGLAYVLLTRGLRQVTALDASLLLLLEPVLNPLWAWLVLGEAPGAQQLLGGSVILIATAAKSLADRRAG